MSTESDTRIDFLFVDSEDSSRHLLEQIVRENKWDYLTVPHTTQALEHLDRGRFHVVVLDENLSPFSGLQIFEWLKNRASPSTVILTGKGGENPNRLKALKMGAFDWISKPFESPDRIAKVLREALDAARLGKPIEALEAEGEPSVGDFDNFVGRHPSIQMVYEMIRRIAPASSSVLVEGESGTGKELVARSIHLNSPRKNKPFVVINSSAMPETLFESELFGYTKGAFTGAIQDKKGLFEIADGGTAFLDEIGDIPLAAQVKLLRVLQGGEIIPLGSGLSRSVDVRIIAATNKDLASLIQKRDFREDLYYRLNVISINLPPLRKRGEDVSLLASYFLHRTTKRIGKKVERMSVDFLHALQTYSWPGNVRELENVMERSIVLSEGPILTAKTLPPRVLSRSFYTPPSEENDWSALTYREAKKRALNIFNHSYIMEILKKTEGNISAAAEIAGLDRSNFKKILRRYRIEGKRMTGE